MFLLLCIDIEFPTCIMLLISCSGMGVVIPHFVHRVSWLGDKFSESDPALQYIDDNMTQTLTLKSTLLAHSVAENSTC